MNKSIKGFEHVYVDKQNPETLLLLHGTGGDEHDLLPLGEEVDPTANLLSPRGKVLEQGWSRFFRRLSEGVFDRKDLEEQSKELAGFIVESSKVYGFTLDRLTAIGYSNGANIALHLMATDPDALSTGILIRPSISALPEKTAELSDDVSILLLSGLRDPFASPADADKLKEILSSHGAEVELKKIPAGHALTLPDITYAKEWLRKLYSEKAHL